MASFISRWNEFFHSRMTLSSNAFRLIGYLRILYGLCILWDRILLSLDFNMFFLYPSLMNHAALSSSTPIATLPLIPCQQYFIPVSETISYPIVDVEYPLSPLCTIAGYFPVSYHHYIFYIFHIISIINAILLIWNVSPKLQLVLLHINMMSLHFHSQTIWDGEDAMFKVWNFLFLFLPLQIPSLPEDKTEKRSLSVSDTASSYSYPMWPIRLFQIEVCGIYAGAGYAKLSNERWRSGNALYHVSSNFYVFVFIQ